MAVEKPSAQYTKFAPLWSIARDVDSGQQAMHEAGTKYIPMFRDEKPADYLARIKRSTFFNATARTKLGLKGMIFRQPPKVDVPSGIKSYLDDVTMAGQSMHQLAESMTDEEILIGRTGLLVDH